MNLSEMSYNLYRAVKCHLTRVNEGFGFEFIFYKILRINLKTEYSPCFSVKDDSWMVELSLIDQVKGHFINKYIFWGLLDCRGFRLESGFKYGCDFILYKNQNEAENHEHGEALVLIHRDCSSEQVHLEIASFLRLASIVRKKAYFVYAKGNRVGLWLKGDSLDPNCIIIQ